MPQAATKSKLEAQGPCTGHRSIIAILHCFSFEYMKSIQIYVDQTLCPINMIKISGNGQVQYTTSKHV